MLYTQTPFLVFCMCFNLCVCVCASEHRLRPGPDRVWAQFRRPHPANSLLRGPDGTALSGPPGRGQQLRPRPEPQRPGLPSLPSLRPRIQLAQKRQGNRNTHTHKRVTSGRNGDTELDFLGGCWFLFFFFLNIWKLILMKETKQTKQKKKEKKIQKNTSYTSQKTLDLLCYGLTHTHTKM